MGEADLPGIEGGEAGWQTMHLVAGGHGSGGGVAGHAAVVADPVDRGGRALEVVLVGVGEGRGHGREVHLEEVDAVAKLDEVLAELVLGELEGGTGEEGLDGEQEGCERGAISGDRCLASGGLSPSVRPERVERVVQIGVEGRNVELRRIGASTVQLRHVARRTTTHAERVELRLIADLESRCDRTTHSCSIEQTFVPTELSHKGRKK